MPTKKKYYRHNCYVTAEEDSFVRKFNLSPSKIYHEALTAIRHDVCESSGKRGVYLSNSANQPKGKSIVDHNPGARNGPAEPCPGTQPAAPIAAQAQAPDHVPVAAHAEIRPDPVPAPTVIIVRKRPAVPDPIIELCEPAGPVAQVSQPIEPVRTIPAIMKRAMRTAPHEWAQLPDRG